MNSPFHLRIPAAILFLLFGLHFLSFSQTTYKVGPGKTYTSIGAVPWESLVAGDSVQIYWKAQPYKEKWVIGVQGTVQKPIVISGVPGISGQLPVIDAVDATTRSNLNFWSEGRGVIKFGGSNTPADIPPTYIVLENLEIKNGRDSFSFTGRNGLTDYDKNCAAIFIESGKNLTIRNCTLTNCGNGLFASYLSEDVLVEGCYIYGNGNAGSIYEHNNYTESRRITFQNNRFGPLCSGCSGNNLKDRSAGTVIRYNWIEGGNRQLDLVNSDHAELLDLPEYHETWVYGNILIEPDGDGNSQIVHYGGDINSEDSYRKGKLFFYNNTMVSNRVGNTTLFRLSSNGETADCFNNILYTAATGDKLALVDATGILNFSRNWTRTGYVSSHGTLTGTINNAGNNIQGTAPGFTNAASQDFSLIPSSVCVDTGIDVPSSHPLDRSYLKHQKQMARPYSKIYDLGAFEYNAGEVPPLQFTLTVTNGTGSGNYSENAKITVTANAPASGKTFDKWTGDIAGLASVYASPTTLTMPAKNTGITAAYKNVSNLTAEDDNDIIVFPNPVQSYSEVITGCKGTVSIQVINIEGKIIKNIANVHDHYLLYLGDCANGVYLIQILSDKSVKTKLIIKN